MEKLITKILMAALLFCGLNLTKTFGTNIPRSLFAKAEITIVITDSGLGGLSVMEDVAKKMKAAHCFKTVNLIFANALFDSNSGYNALPKREDKIRIFNDVLTSLDQRFKPDVILVACNTLSVLCGETPFVSKSKTPVVGIVDAGVQLVTSALAHDTAASVILFGTETTIEEGSHRKALLAMSIPEKRIIAKACPQLQSYIEQNPNGEETEMLISLYVNEALEQIPLSRGAVYLSLNCSHFGYAEELWKRAFAATSYQLGAVLDPNSLMGDFLVEEKSRKKFAETTVTFHVVSKVKLLNEDAMIHIFSTKSPQLAKALGSYELIPGLFGK